MVIKFADGIDIVIDDEKLIGWQPYSFGDKILVMTKEREGYRNFEFDKSSAVFKELK